MCRIAGIFNRQIPDLKEQIVVMRDAMRHGGPDHGGLYLNPEGSLGLGHRRLSIIDLSEDANQPMLDNSANTILVFNGEIYNYLELRAELVREGYSFRTRSDTEVVLAAYKLWGVDSFRRFNGMFALAIYDQLSNTLVLARDQAGIKPLYLYTDNHCLYFASEVRSFAALGNRFEEDEHWRVHFLTYGFLPHPHTTLRQVISFPKGTVRVYDLANLSFTTQSFYPVQQHKLITDYTEAKSEVALALRGAVKRNLLADAPLGIFLSGGIDSSLLTLLASEFTTDIRTLSLIFDDPAFTEHTYQEQVSLKANTSHATQLMTEESFVNALPDIFQAMDQPTTDGVNSYFISKFAHEAGLKVVLSGLGADELFGGYPSFGRDRILRGLRTIPGNVLGLSGYMRHDKYRKIAFLRNKNLVGDYLFNRGYYIPREVARILDASEQEVIRILSGTNVVEPAADQSFFNRTAHIESELYMQSQLLKDTDFMSMWFGLEVRVPFLDNELLHLLPAISSKIKAGGKRGKQLLIDSFPSVLPEAIWNREKQGFVFPFAKWMQSGVGHYIPTKMGVQLRDRFFAGKLSWSRYWAYILLQTFATEPAKS